MTLIRKLKGAPLLVSIEIRLIEEEA